MPAGMTMRSGIVVAVVGAIVLVVMFAVLPTIFGAMGQTFQLTQDACVYSNERFTSIIAKGSHTTADAAWNASSASPIPITAGTAGACSGTAAAAAHYTPQGQQFTLATADTFPTSQFKWEATLPIVAENRGINRLIITALPILAVVGIFIPVMAWWRGRSAA